MIGRMGVSFSGEPEDWKDTAKRYRKLTDEPLDRLIADGSLVEIVVPA